MSGFIFMALAIICLIFGFLGCFINKIPGPFSVVIAVILAKYGMDVNYDWGTIVLIIILAILSVVFSKFLVKGAKRLQEFSKRASWGITLGSIVGLILFGVLGKDASTFMIIMLLILNLVLVPFLFAFLFELTKKLGTQATLKRASAATMVFLTDTCLKLGVFAYAVYVMFMG